MASPLSLEYSTPTVKTLLGFFKTDLSIGAVPAAVADENNCVGDFVGAGVMKASANPTRRQMATNRIFQRHWVLTSSIRETTILKFVVPPVSVLLLPACGFRRMIVDGWLDRENAML